MPRESRQQMYTNCKENKRKIQAWLHILPRPSLRMKTFEIFPGAEYHCRNPDAMTISTTQKASHTVLKVTPVILQ